MDPIGAANTPYRTFIQMARAEGVSLECAPPTRSRRPPPIRLRASLLVLVVISAVLSACVPARLAPSPPGASGAAGTTRVAEAAPRMAIYAPATTSSVPVILAVQQMSGGPNQETRPALTLFTNQSQASTLFLRGDVDVLVTGLSVGLQFFKNGAPVQVANCYVAGLTYLVTYGQQVSSLDQLKGDSLYVPFEGSPIEEISQYFAQRAGLRWKEDIKPVYAPFDSSLALLKQGKAHAVALPEPYVTLAEQEPQVRVSLNYRAMWDALAGSNDGYPQVCTFVRKPWAATRPKALAEFNAALAGASASTQLDPEGAAHKTAAALGLPENVLRPSLRRTDLAFRSGDAMALEIRRYYQTIGKPLDGSYDGFFYLHVESGPE